MSLRIYLMRHGESAWNQLHRYTGQQNIPLSERGAAQAQRLAERLTRVPLDAIYTSPLQRAQATAGAIARLKCLPLQIDPRLVEIHHGAWEGLSTQQVRERFGAEYAQWRTAPHQVVMPHGESLADVAQRVESFLSDVLRAYPSPLRPLPGGGGGGREVNLAIVSHDAVLRVIVHALLKMGLENFWQWRFDNASLSALERLPDGNFRVAFLNDTSHLDGWATNSEGQAL